MKRFEKLTLFAVLLGCKPSGRNTEQHDVFFGIGHELSDMKNAIKKFWPEAEDDIHVDAYIPLTHKDGYDISLEPIGNGKTDESDNTEDLRLFFINLGGYDAGVFDEAHKKLFFVASEKHHAITQAKQDPFYTSRANNALGSNARGHVDDKVLVDEILCVNDQISGFRIVMTKSVELKPDPVPVITGYFILSKIVSSEQTA